MNIPTFVLGEQIELEESMTCEFKEVKGQPPVQAICRVIDEYVVAFLNARGGSVYWGIRDDDHRVVGVRLNGKTRDELRQVAGQKLGAIAPPVAPDAYALPLHPVVRLEDRHPLEDTFVVEVSVQAVSGGSLYLTGSGEAYRRTLAGTKKLSGAELLSALLTQLDQKLKASAPDTSDESPDLAWMPSVAHRARVVRPLLRGARILWVDDNPASTLYERTVLASLGVSTDVALSTQEALYMVDRLTYDLILSDMKRAGNPTAGVEMLNVLTGGSSAAPVVYYVGQFDRRQGTPLGAFAITNRPDELLHYVFDVLERRHGEVG